ncbi:MAG: MFS transporter [Immundisolibacter sp.]|uniref:MFS transporter n=1 Tax=Immundisolibacter sp. TaxID=1934948 RepID=UPI003D09E4E8
MTGTDQAMADGVRRKISLRLIPLLIVIYILAHLDRVNVSFAALTMNEDLGFSNAVYGLGAGLFFFGYFLFEVPANKLLERVGARRLIGSIMLIWGAVSAAMAAITSPTQFYVMRFVLGVAESGLYPGIILYLTYWFRSADRATAIGQFALALAVAGLLGSPLSGAIMDNMNGLAGLAGWKWLFIVEGLPTVLLGLVVLMTLPDRPAEARWLAADERRWIEGALAADRAAAPAVAHGTLRQMFHPTVLLLGLAYFMFLGAFTGVIFWAPKLAHALDAQMSATAVGWLVGAPYLLFGAALILWGRHSDRTAERHWHVSLGALVAAAGYVGMAYSSTTGQLLMAMFVALLGAGAAFSCFWGLVTATIPPAMAAVGIAVVNSAGALGAFVTVSALGRLLELTHSYRPGVLLFSGAAVLAAVAVQMVPRPRLRPAQALAG